MSSENTILLNTGKPMPLVGIGTFLAPPGEVGAAVLSALNAGYRHVDCASMYENEKEVGAALKEFFGAGNKREDVFLTSKLAAYDIQPGTVEKALRATLGDLGVDYLDLYLVHQAIPVESDPEWDGKHRIIGKYKPIRGQGWGMQDVWGAMESCHEKGLVKSIGVSNFNSQLLNDMLLYAKIPPAVNQIERHPYLQQNNFVAFNKKNDVVITAYAPLGAPGLFSGEEKPLLQNETIVSISKAHNKTPAQILIRWSVDSKVVVIPKSQKPHRVVENFDVWDFQLSEEEMKKIGELDRAGRLFAQDWMGVPCFE